MVTNKVITRDWIHKDFILDDGWNESRRDEIIFLIKKWKYFLQKKFNIKKGMTLGLCTSILDEKYFSLFFAAAELGLKFVVFPRPETIDDLNNYKLEIYKPIDIIAFDIFNQENPVIKKFIDEFGKSSISMSCVNDDINEKDFKDFKDEILADNDSEILLTTSSGTTDRPKLIKHTHKFFYDLCIRNAKVMDFQGNDRILHIRNLHHGSSLGVFFLPSIYSCKYHFSCNFQDTDIDELLDSLKKNNITKLSVPYNSIIDSILNSTEFFPKLTIFNLSFLKPSWIEDCKNNKIKEIKSIFGCNETSGPIFIPKVDKHTSNNHNLTNFGNLLDDFYEVRNIDNTLEVYLRCYNKWVDTGDAFDIVDQEYIFVGKKQIVRINDILIDTENFRSLIKKHVKNEHIVIFDREYEKIYLGILDDYNYAHIDKFSELNNILANEISPLIKISDVKYIVKEKYLYGIKIDHEKLRRFFRSTQ